MKKAMFLFICFIVFSVLFIGVYFSPIGNDFLEKYVISKICFEKKFRPFYFDHSFNSFSLILKKDNNIIQIYGTLFPFKANYNAKFSNINSIFPKLQGKVLAMGEIDNKKTTGNLFFAKAQARMNLICRNGNIKGEIKGKNFNTGSFLNMFKDLNLKEFNLSFNGINDLNIKFDKYFLLKADFIGNIIIFNKKIASKIKNLLEYDKDNFSYKGSVDSNDIEGFVKINKDENGIEYVLKFYKIDLNIFKKIVLIPIQKKLPLNIFYDSLNKVYDFQSDNFSGFYKNKSLIFQFKMPSKNFFDFLSLPEILKGIVIGNGRIFDKKGKFNLLIENAVIKKSILKNLKKHINIKYNPNIKGKIFITGKFDTKKAVFNLISKDLNYFWSIKNGVYYFDGRYYFILKLNTGKYTYLIRVKNNNIKLLKKVNNQQTAKTLVF